MRRVTKRWTGVRFQSLVVDWAQNTNYPTIPWAFYSRRNTFDCIKVSIRWRTRNKLNDRYQSFMTLNEHRLPGVFSMFLYARNSCTYQRSSCDYQPLRACWQSRTHLWRGVTRRDARPEGTRRVQLPSFVSPFTRSLCAWFGIICTKETILSLYG